MSSSDANSLNSPRSHSAATRARPATSAAASSAVSSAQPGRASARAYADEPARSARHSRRSNDRLRLKACMAGSTAPLKRPPHSALGADDAPPLPAPAPAPAPAAAAATLLPLKRRAAAATGKSERLIRKRCDAPRMLAAARSGVHREARACQEA
jgi:hypothetical protein